MTLVEFFGCTFLAFGPPFAMFTLTIVQDPIRIIVLIMASFFWLVSVFMSALLWFAVVPLRDKFAFGLVFSVLFQELFRFLMYKLLRKAEGGLKKVTDNSAQIIANKHTLAYVGGLGFGIISGAFALMNVVADAIGPGTMGLKQGSDLFFITSAATTLAFILLHTLWGVIFFSALDDKNIFHLVWVVGSHMFVSCMTLFNQWEMYSISLTSVYVTLLLTALIAYNVAGGTFKSLKRSFTCG